MNGSHYWMDQIYIFLKKGCNLLYQAQGPYLQYLWRICVRKRWTGQKREQDTFGLSQHSFACLSQDKRLRDELIQQMSPFPWRVEGTGIREPETVGLWRTHTTWLKGAHTVNRTSFSVFTQKIDYCDILFIYIRTYLHWQTGAICSTENITINMFIQCGCGLGGKVGFCTFLKVTLRARLQGPGIEPMPFVSQLPLNHLSHSRVDKMLATHLQWYLQEHAYESVCSFAS